MCGKCENAHAEWIFFFFGPWGLWLQSVSIFLEEVSCCKWRVSIEFISCLSFSTTFVTFPFVCIFIQSNLPFPPSVVFVSLFPFIAFPPSVLFSHFLSSCVSFPFYPCLPHLSLTLSLPFSVFLSPVCCIFRPLQTTPLDKQDSKFALQHSVRHHILHCK